MFDIKKLFPLKSLRIILGGVLIAVTAVTAVTVPLFTNANAETSLLYGAAAENAFLKNGCGLYVDGVFIAAMEKDDKADALMTKAADALAKAYGAPKGINSLCNDVKTVKGNYLKESFASEDDILALLGCLDSGVSNVVYTVSGQLTDLTLNVATTANIKKEESVVADYVPVGTDLLPNGEEIVVKESVDGVNLNEYSVTYVNGVETASSLIGNTVITAPISGEKWYGTDSGATLMSDNDKFMLPCTGWVTSWYGSRFIFGSVSNHSAIDLAGEGGSYGDPIFAAEDGIVSYSGWHGNYGKKITVDHSKELSTVYAHCSNIIVNVGDVVRKGQIIGYIGATGRVTGPHLHFEVWKNGVKTNPKNYIDWSAYQWGEVK